MYIKFEAICIGMGHNSMTHLLKPLPWMVWCLGSCIVVLAGFTALQCLLKVLQPNMLCRLKLSAILTIDTGQIIKLRIVVLYALVYIEDSHSFYNTVSDEHNPNLHYMHQKVKIY